MSGETAGDYYLREVRGEPHPQETRGETRMSGTLSMDEAITAVITANPNGNLTASEVRERASAMISRHELANLEQAMANVAAEQAAHVEAPDESHGLNDVMQRAFRGG